MVIFVGLVSKIKIWKTCHPIFWNEKLRARWNFSWARYSWSDNVCLFSQDGQDKSRTELAIDFDLHSLSRPWWGAYWEEPIQTQKWINEERLGYIFFLIIDFFFTLHLLTILIRYFALFSLCTFYNIEYLTLFYSQSWYIEWLN